MSPVLIIHIRLVDSQRGYGRLGAPWAIWTRAPLLREMQVETFNPRHVPNMTQHPFLYASRNTRPDWPMIQERRVRVFKASATRLRRIISTISQSESTVAPASRRLIDVSSRQSERYYDAFHPCARSTVGTLMRSRTAWLRTIRPRRRAPKNQSADPRLGRLGGIIAGSRSKRCR